MLSSSCLQPIGTDSGPYLDLYPPSSGGDILQDASVYNRLNLAQSDFCDQQCTAFAYQAAESEELPPEKQAPVLDPIENKTVEEGSLLSFTVAATDPDPGQILTYELDPHGPRWR
jgi:hypothetical protein